jgi:hypothetical protein
LNSLKGSGKFKYNRRFQDMLRFDLDELVNLKTDQIRIERMQDWHEGLDFSEEIVDLQMKLVITTPKGRFNATLNIIKPNIEKDGKILDNLSIITVIRYALCN